MTYLPVPINLYPTINYWTAIAIYVQYTIDGVDRYTFSNCMNPVPCVNIRLANKVPHAAGVHV